MFFEIKEDDIIFIIDMVRVSRNIKEVIEVVEIIKIKGVIINILNSKIDFNDLVGKFVMFVVLNVIEELNKELEQIRKQIVFNC